MSEQQAQTTEAPEIEANDTVETEGAEAQPKVIPEEIIEGDIPDMPDSIKELYNKKNQVTPEDEQISQEGVDEGQEEITDPAEPVSGDEQDSPTQEAAPAQPAYVPTQYELVKAQQFGLTSEQVSQAGPNIGTLLLQAELLAGSKGEQQPPQEEKPLFDKITVPENEDMDESQKEMFQSMADQFNSQIDTLNEQHKLSSEQALLSNNAALEQQQKVFDQYWDGKVEALPPEIKELIGDANELHPGTPQYDKHKELFSTFDALSNGFRETGMTKTDDELFVMATNSVFADNIKVSARKDLEAKVIKRGSQTIERPTARTGKEIDADNVKTESEQLKSAFDSVMNKWDKEHPDQLADRTHYEEI